MLLKDNSKIMIFFRLLASQLQLRSAWSWRFAEPL